MTVDIPDYAGRPYPPVHNEPPKNVQWEAMSQDQLDGLRKRLIESLIQVVVQAVTGIFIPGGGIGGASNQLTSWATDIIDRFLGVLSADSALNAGNLFGLLPFDVFGGQLPLTDLFNFIPELLVDPLFQFAESILGGDIFTIDETQTPFQGSKWLKVTADGQPNELFGAPIRVNPGQKIDAGVRTKWSGLSGSGSPIKLVLALFNDAGDGSNPTAVTEIVLDSEPYAATGGTGTPVALAGTHEIATSYSGVVANRARTKLEVGETATAGTVWFAKPTMTKPLQTSLWADQLGLSGLWDMLGTVLSGIPVVGSTIVSVLTQGLAFFDAIGGGSGSDLTDILQRFLNLGQDGSFFAGGLGSINSIPAITQDDRIPGLGLLRGVLGGGTNLGGSTDTWDLSSLFGSFTRQSEQLAENTAALNELLTQQIEQDTSGTRAIEKFEYVDPDSMTETLWDVEWLSGTFAQARITVSDGHNAGMERISGTNIAELARYQGPGHTTETNYQRVAVVVYSPMQSGSETHIYMRMSVDRTKWVRWNYRCTSSSGGTVILEYKNGGAITQLGSSATFSTPPVGSIIAGVAGTDGGENAFEAFIGTKRVHTVTDGGNVHAKGATQRESGWGQKYVSALPGKITQFTTGDNVPVAVVGTTMRVFRAATGGVTKGGGSGPIPANTFDTVDYISTDMAWNATTSTLTLSKAGTYLFSGRFEMSNPIGFSEELYPTIVVNSVDRIRGGARRGITAAAFGVPHFPRDLSAGGDAMLLYCAAGTTIKFGFFATQSNTVIGDAAGGKTWFSAVRIG